MSRPAASDLPSQPDDVALLHQARRGDEAAFEALVQRHGPALHTIALYLTGHAGDAEDVVQETLLAAYERLGSFEARSTVKTWLSRILVYRAARHHRSQKVRRAAHKIQLSEASKALLEGAVTGVAADAEEIRLDVLDVLQDLQPDHREVLVLRELDGMSYQQIAETLDVPVGTIESRIHRGRQELKQKLKDYAG